MARFYHRYERCRAPCGPAGEDLWAVIKVGYWCSSHGGATISTEVVADDLPRADADALWAVLDGPMD